jgi:protease-4
MKRSKAPLFVGLAIVGIMGLVALGGLILAASVGSGSSGGRSFSFSFWGDKVALLEVNGVLGEGPGYTADTAWLADQVRDWTEDSSIKGMVIRVNSPGGAVSATQDLFNVIQEFRDSGRPVMVSMGDIAASGGVYIAMAGDEVYANSGTLTGSVGVILSFYGYKDLLDKIGLEARTIKSGQFKDIGSGTREMTLEEKELLETMIVDVYDQFFEVVLDAREEAARDALAGQRSVKASTVSDEEVAAHLKEHCDGRIFSGRQAVELGMVDGLLTIDEVISKMKSDLGLEDSARVVPTRRKPVGLFGPAARALNHTLPRKLDGNVAFEYRFSM